MFSRVKTWFSGRSAEPGRREEAQMVDAFSPVAASSQVRAFTLDEFFLMSMENRLHEDEERGAGGDSAAISPASSSGLYAEGPPSPDSAATWPTICSGLYAEGPPSRDSAATWPAMCSGLYAEGPPSPGSAATWPAISRRLYTEGPHSPDSAATWHAICSGLYAEGPPSPESLPPVPRQWRWRPQTTRRGRRTRLQKIFLCIRKLCCLGVGDQEAEEEAEEEELNGSPVADSFQCQSTQNQFLLFLVEQLEQMEEDKHAEEDAEDPLQSTSAAVPLASDVSPEPLRSASHFRASRRRRRQGRAMQGPTGQQAASVRSRCGYRLSSRLLL